MRVELEKLNGKRIKVIATLDAKGKAYIDGKYIKTVCVVNVVNSKDNKYLSDHCWIKTDKLKGVSKGSKISFVGTIEIYYKLYKGNKVMDYQFVDIKYVKVL